MTSAYKKYLRALNIAKALGSLGNWGLHRQLDLNLATAGCDGSQVQTASV